jgi:hypothetical protein
VQSALNPLGSPSAASGSQLSEVFRRPWVASVAQNIDYWYQKIKKHPTKMDNTSQLIFENENLIRVSIQNIIRSLVVVVEPKGRGVTVDGFRGSGGQDVAHVMQYARMEGALPWQLQWYV